MTGSLTPGTVAGLAGALRPNEPLVVNGNPSGLVISPEVSGLALDRDAGSIFMATTVGDSIWIALGSAEF